MAIALDKETVGAAFSSTGTQTTSHVPIGTPRAACVIVTQTTTAADEISGITYGGAAMTRLRFDTESTEAGAVYIYWLDGVATGTQNVAMTTTAASQKCAVIWTMTTTSSGSVQVAGHNTGTSASVANPSWTITGLTAASVLMAFEGIHSGLQTMTATPATGWTLSEDLDEGATGRGHARQAVASSGTSLTCGWTASTADDFVGSSVAFIQGPPATSAAAGLASGTGTAPAPSLTLASNAAPGNAAGTGTAPGVSNPPRFTAVGTQQTSEPTASGSSATFSLTTVGAGNWVLLELVCNTQAATAVSGGLGGGTWTQLGTTVSLSSLGAGSAGNVWAGQVAAAGTATVTLTFGGTPGTIRAVSREFAVASGVIALDVQGSINAQSANWASLTPSGTGELYWGYAKNNGVAVAGTTPADFVFEIDSFSNGEGYCLSVSAAYQPVWGDSLQLAGVMVLLKDSAGGTSANAGIAAGTGTAPAPGLTLAANAAPGNAAATGTAPQPAAQVAFSAAAGLASGTGTAPVPALTLASRALPAAPAGTGTAPAPGLALAANANAGPAAGTGTAPGVSASTTAGTTANAGLASGTGTAPGPGLTLAGNAAPGPASGTGTAPVPALTLASRALPAAPAGTGTAPAPSLTLAGNAAAAAAAGIGTAPGVTASSSSAVQANAGNAPGTGTAPAPGVTAASRALPAAATGTGTAPGATTQTARLAVPGLAAGTGTAPAAALLLAANAAALAALGAGTAPPAAGTGNVPAVNATSAAAVTAAVTSVPVVTDPRDGTSLVSAAATSSPAVT